jgi:CubicO group peptidase (beta-lactamase class C family)
MKKKAHIFKVFIFTALVIPALLFAWGTLPVVETQEAPAYWPTQGWQSSTPEKQGVDSEKLADMLERIKSQKINIRSVVVIRNGNVLLEACFHPYKKDTWHTIHSCTKSIISALIGIAIDKGYIESVKTPVLEFFPDRTAANLDENKKALTLEHLLTMSSGFLARDSYLYNWQGLAKMRASRDWIQYVLDLPIANAPGSKFDYSNCTSFLLSAILQESTGTNALTFAKEHLFGPLGIQEIVWPSNPQGITLGWGGIRMKPLDMAKIGFLYLNRGVWEGKQVVSSSWVEASTRQQIKAGTLSDGYGYQWWVNKDGYFMALGYSGQYIVVLPQQNMVVVFTSALPSIGFFVPHMLLRNYILPAAKSSTPLPDNPEGEKRLQSVLYAISNPKASTVPVLPEIAQEISGKIYIFDANPLDFKRLALDFGAKKDEALLTLSFRNRDFQVPVGLDNVYRLTKATGYLRAYRGFWENDKTFVIDYQIVDFSERGKIRVTFEGEKMTLMLREEVRGSSRKLTARLKD